MDLNELEQAAQSNDREKLRPLDILALIAYAHELEELLMKAVHERETLRTRIAELEPGKVETIMAGMWDEAVRLGHSPVSSRHALSYLVEQIESLRVALSDALDVAEDIAALPTGDWRQRFMEEHGLGD